MTTPTHNLPLPDLEGSPGYCGNAPHVFVHQRQYVPMQGARVDPFTTDEITFRNGGICGISIRDGVSKRYSGLERRDSRPFEGMDVADSCTLRVEWPGFPTWNKSFRTRDSTSARSSVPLSRLATDICKGIEKFIQEMDGGPCGERTWRVGGNAMLNVDNLALVSLKRASYGSWTARIRVISLDSGSNLGGT